ncbi:tRNA epoxyqueuosine(34) reductase QueG [Aquaspirillum sp. LM1]|nr:tRNA epoxyqueuosine(34) reductase QueG [Aquaspirillum sp. LM1]
MCPEPAQNRDYPELAQQIKAWAYELGFSGVSIGRAALPESVEQSLLDWLAAGFHGEMDYMARHGVLRARPAELVPGALTVISVRLPYRDPAAADMHAVLADGEKAAIARYALGRDYHKTLRNRLQKLADRLVAAVGPVGYRVFTDSAPLMEVALASQSGLGWRGKHTLLIQRDEGSFFFLGELLTDLPLPLDAPTDAHCGRCTRCLDACPTQAIVAPYQLDARRCISYLTIELAGSIPEPLRALIGNRVYGCDDCQLVCPWNRFAVPTSEADFAVRHGLDHASLASLFAWEASDFTQRMAGSPIYRIGHERWLRNLAVGLGNAPATPAVLAALLARRDHPSALVREHVGWALARQGVI